MKLVNQNDYANVKYITKTKNPDYYGKTTIKSSGCGICCAMMVADFFGYDFSLDEAINLAYDCGATNSVGTNYKYYAPAFAKRFNLYCIRTDKVEDVYRTLDDGGIVIANVGGDHDDYQGIFSHLGHYIVVSDHNGDEIEIYDPGLEDGKYDEENRHDKVRVENDIVYSHINNLISDVQNRQYPFFLFEKRTKKPEITDVFVTIDALKDEYVQKWVDICKIDSPTDYKEGVDKVCQYFVDEAIKHIWRYEVFKEEISGDALFITINENSKKRPISLSGHMDTVHPVNSLSTYIENGKIYGPGVCDCKGGLIISLLVMDALIRCGYDEREIRFILQSDEEVGSRYSDKRTIQFMCEKAKGSLGFINLEMSVPGSIVTERKGIARYKMTITGKAVHASVCYAGVNAICEAAYKIIELEKMKDKDGITMSVDVISGGLSANSVADKCVLDIDVRFSNNKQMEEAENYIKEIAEKSYLDGSKCTWEKLSSRPPLEYQKANYDLATMMNEAFKKCGLSELTTRKALGGADSAYASQYGIPSIDSLGVSGSGIHSPNEYANIDSLVENAKRIVAFILLNDK